MLTTVLITTPPRSPLPQHVNIHDWALRFLFVRRYRSTETGTAQPWMLLGPADYVEHRGERPMGVVWRLRHEIPADVWTYSAIAAG